VLPSWSKPIRTVLRWQGIATAVLAAAAGILDGVHAAVSAGLGGLVSIVAGGVFLAIGTFGKTDSAGGALIVALKAEVAKLLTIVLLPALVLVTYSKVVVAALIGSLIVCTVISSMAVSIRTR
jgi:hypothetical protein